MRSIKERLGLSPKLPKGNEWDFPGSPVESARFREDFFEFTEISEASPVLQQMVSQLEEHYLQEGWNFAAVFGFESDLESPKIQIFFTNLDRTETTKKYPPLDYIVYDEVETVTDWPREQSVFQLKPNHINEALQGTNLLSNIVTANYNELTVNEPVGILRDIQPVTYIQTGVVVVDMMLQPIGRAIERQDSLIAGREEAVRHSQQILADDEMIREKLANSIVDDPEPIFGNPQS